MYLQRKRFKIMFVFGFEFLGGRPPPSPPQPWCLGFVACSQDSVIVFNELAVFFVSGFLCFLKDMEIISLFVCPKTNDGIDD